MNKQIMVLIASCILTFSHSCFSMERDEDTTSPDRAIVPYQHSPTGGNLPSNTTTTTQPSLGTSATTSNADAKPPKKNPIVPEEESEEEVTDDEDDDDNINLVILSDNATQEDVENMLKNCPKGKQKIREEDDNTFDKITDEKKDTVTRSKHQPEEGCSTGQEIESHDLPEDSSKWYLAEINDFMRPSSIRLSVAQQIVRAARTQANIPPASVGIIGSILMCLCYRLKDMKIPYKIITLSSIAVGGFALLVGGCYFIRNNTYERLNNQPQLFLRSTDDRYRDEIDKDLNNLQLHPLALLSKYFNVRAFSPETNINTTFYILKSILILMKFGVIAVESTPNRAILYTNMNEEQEFIVDSFESINELISQCTEITCSSGRTFGFIRELDVPEAIEIFSNLQKLVIHKAISITLTINSFPHKRISPTLPYLTHLEISDSERSMHEFLKKIHHNSVLQTLILQNNKIQNSFLESKKTNKLPLGFSQLPSLTHLDLSHNELTYVPNHIPTLTSLNLLELSHNKLRTLPQQITQLQTNCRLNALTNPLNDMSNRLKKQIRKALPNAQIP